MKKAPFKMTVIQLGGVLAAVLLAAFSVVIHKDAFKTRAAGKDGAETDFGNGALFEGGAAGGFPKVDAVEAALDSGEKIIARLVLDGDFTDEEIAVYRNENEYEGRVYVTQIKRDSATKEFVRTVTIPSLQLISDTVSLYTKDLLGDRSVCVLLSGVSIGGGERALVVFRMEDGALRTIGTFLADGSVTVNEEERGDNYNRGVTGAKAFTISTISRPISRTEGQIETVYTYNAGAGQYEKTAEAALPEVTQDNARVRDILAGGRDKIAEAASGLWYLVNAEGSITRRQYVYIDSAAREIVFYADDSQEVFAWKAQTQTRFGLYLTANNISVTTLRRFIDIEIVSVDSIRLKVFEDVQLKIEITAQWDGLYRKMPPLKDKTQYNAYFTETFTDAVYESRNGVYGFDGKGFYYIESMGNKTEEGRYAFFNLGGEEMLELRQNGKDEDGNKLPREVFQVARDGAGLVLQKVRIGVRKIEKIEEQMPLALYARKEEIVAE